MERLHIYILHEMQCSQCASHSFSDICTLILHVHSVWLYVALAILAMHVTLFQGWQCGSNIDTVWLGYDGRGFVHKYKTDGTGAGPLPQRLPSCK